MLNKHTTLIGYQGFTASMNKNPLRYQSGVVLIVSLIILLALTLIGITGTQVTGLEEKMAANSKDTNVAFQAADAALRAAESILGGSSAPASTAYTINGVNGLYTTVGTTAQPAYYNTIDWNSTNSVKPYVSYSTGPLAGTHAAPAYIIEQLETSTTTEDTLEGGGSGTGTVDTSWYRVTARAVGTDANAVVILQSIYKR